MTQRQIDKDGEAAGIKAMSTGLADEGMAPLSGCTPDGLARELLDHAPEWIFASKVDALKHRTALIITSDDGLAPANRGFGADLRKAGDPHVTTVHLPADHAYSDQQFELSQSVLKRLANLAKQLSSGSTKRLQKAPAMRARLCGNLKLARAGDIVFS